MILFREYVADKWFIVSSNTQLVYLWIKDLNECTLPDKDENLSCLIAICQSSTVFEYMVYSKDENERGVLKGNQYVTSGKKESASIKQQDN